MSIRSFRELRVWQMAMDAAMQVFETTKRFPAEERYSLADQIRRSSRSVPANIAEAWRKRRYPAAFVSKLNDAEGEAAETQTHVEMAMRCGYLHAEEAHALDDQYEQILAMLVTMAARPEDWSIRPVADVARHGGAENVRHNDEAGSPAGPRSPVSASPRPRVSASSP